MSYSIAQQSNQGGREYNEDRTAIFERDNHVLLVLADGLGGHAGGDIASQAMIDSIGESFLKATHKQLIDPENFLALSINYAHHFIHRKAKQNDFPVNSPKTTCVVCLVTDGVAQWAHSGDSRLYIIRNKDIMLRTTDHVTEKFQGNNPINRCVGGHELPRPDISEPVKLLKDDCIFLASDGAWASFKTPDLLDYIDPSHPSLGLDNLLQKLESRNQTPSDNLSIVILFWGQKQINHTFVTDESLQNNHELVYQDKVAENVPKQKEKFDITNLNASISEIEDFIIDVEEKL